MGLQSSSMTCCHCIGQLQQIKSFVLDPLGALFCRHLSGPNYSSQGAYKCVNTQRFTTDSLEPTVLLEPVVCSVA